MIQRIVRKDLWGLFFCFFENFFVPILTSGGLAAVSSSAFAALYSAFGKYDVVHIHAEGPAFFAWLPKMFGKRVVVGVGMDTQMLSNSKEVCKEPLFLTMSQDKNLKLLYIGKFEKRRNIHFILDVFSQVINKKMNATLYMIGTGDKDYIEDCWKYAESKNIKGSSI